MFDVPERGSYKLVFHKGSLNGLNWDQEPPKYAVVRGTHFPVGDF